MPSIIVVAVPLVLAFWIGGATNFFIGFLVWFGSSWVLGAMWQASRGTPLNFQRRNREMAQDFMTAVDQAQKAHQIPREDAVTGSCRLIEMHSDPGVLVVKADSWAFRVCNADGSQRFALDWNIISHVERDGEGQWSLSFFDIGTITGLPIFGASVFDVDDPARFEALIAEHVDEEGLRRDAEQQRKQDQDRRDACPGFEWSGSTHNAPPDRFCEHCRSRERTHDLDDEERTDLIQRDVEWAREVIASGKTYNEQVARRVLKEAGDSASGSD